MKIAVFEVEQWERAAFDPLDGVTSFTHGPLTEANASGYSDFDIISTFIYSNLSANVLSSLKSLKLIATRSTGFDHIDVGWCARHGITVANVPAYGDNTVAEHVFGLLLAISHNIIEASERTRRGNFSSQGLMGFDLRGKTLGVLGTGKIGLRVIEIAKGFHMEVLAFDLFPKHSEARKLGFRYASLADLLAGSDVITLHLPSNPSTVNFLSTPQFKKMKDGVVVINTARGNLVDVQALLQALADGKVSAVGLDVLPGEPVIREEAELLRSMAQKKQLDTLLADHILLRLNNVIVTPHTAFYTKEALQRILDTTVENILSYLSGREKNIVNV